MCIEFSNRTSIQRFHLNLGKVIYFGMRERERVGKFRKFFSYNEEEARVLCVKFCTSGVYGGAIIVHTLSEVDV